MSNQFTNTIISSISYALPSRKIDNNEIVSLNNKIDEAKIQLKYGVETRYWCSKTEDFYGLALESTKRLLESSSTNSKDIEFVILLTQSTHNQLPSQVHKLSAELDFNSNVFAIEISQGCAGFIYGLKLASSLRNSFKKGIIIVGDTYSKIINSNDTATLPIFGDGVASILIDNKSQDFSSGINHESFKFFNNGNAFNKLICGPDSNGKLFMDGPAVFNFVISDVQKLLKNYDLKSYNQIFLHQASKYTFDMLVERLDIKNNSPSNLLKFGNMTSASIPILMAENNFMNLKMRKILLCGFGVGLSAGACEYVIT